MPKPAAAGNEIQISEQRTQRRKRKRAFNLTTDRERDRQPLVGFGRVIVHTSHEENGGEEQRGRTQFVVNVPARERRVIFSGGNPPLPLHFLGFLGEDNHSPLLSPSCFTATPV